MFPLPDIQAQTVADAFFFQWIGRFGVPKLVVTDGGAQFSGHIWRNLMECYGIKHQITLAYHPQENGIVERLNKSLKTSLRTQERPTGWFSYLGLVLLGLRSVVKKDLGYAPSELVYGSTLRLPGELLDPHDSPTIFPASDYIQNMRQFFRNLTPVQTRDQDIANPYLSRHLDTCTHAFLRVDAGRGSLDSKYTGPHKVLERSNRAFTIDKDGITQRVTVDRIKPAFLPLQHIVTDDKAASSDATAAALSPYSDRGTNAVPSAAPPDSPAEHGDARTQTDTLLSPDPVSPALGVQTRTGRQTRLPGYLSGDFVMSRT